MNKNDEKKKRTIYSKSAALQVKDMLSLKALNYLQPLSDQYFKGKSIISIFLATFMKIVPS